MRRYPSHARPVLLWIQPFVIDVHISSQGSRGRKGAPKRASEAVDGTFQSSARPLALLSNRTGSARARNCTALSLPHHLVGVVGDEQRASFPRPKRRVNDRRRTPTWRLPCPQMCAPRTPHLSRTISAEGASIEATEWRTVTAAMVVALSM